MTPGQKEALEAVELHGGIRPAARALGVAYSGLHARYRRALEWLEAPEGQKSAIEVSGLDIGTAKHGWRVIQREDGSRDSVFWKADPGEQDSLIDRIKDAFSDLPAADPIPVPPHKAKDLLTLYPIADAHIGMLAWGAETGEDYDTSIATKRLVNWLGQAVEASPPSETAVILDVGDLTHADDQTNQTPRSKHVLDVDTRHFRTIDMTIAALVTATKLALKKHNRVIVRILPGNHNPTSYMAVLFALAEHFRNEPRVEVQKEPGEFFAHQFGVNMICAHHGDKAKAERMVLFLADEFPEMWGQTRHRFLWTGHLHHHKSQDIGGVKHEQLRALTARDAYAASHAYCARAQLQAVTYHREKGEVGRVKVTA
ncbi:hypothetical protein [uncultured Ruegeria sp.]|uniref:hypothetical protein n=1 Tax=uncultured Ruegeria sp. TaxID=259304 RepID=UPI002628AFC2|nr:hypothetical protein [uncultured Ruegeria sp.]